VTPTPTPETLSAEKTVLGTLLGHPEHIEELSSRIAATDYADPKHEAIHDAILTVRNAGTPVDAISVAEHLRSHRALERVGGPAYLHQLVSYDMPVDTASHHAQLVREAAARRRVTELGTRIATLPADQNLLDLIPAARALLDQVEQASSDTSLHPARLRVITASDVQVRRVVYTWERRIPTGAITLMPGEEGIGKTTVGARIIADLTHGTLPGEHHGNPRDVIVIALEDGLEDVYVPRLAEAGADLNRVHIIRARVKESPNELPYEADIVIPRDLDLIAAEVKRVGAAMVWIDSLVTTLPDDLKAIAYKDTAKVLKTISGWAELHRIAVVAPWHLNKSTGSDTATRMMDSRAFRTAVRSVLLVVADPDAPEGTTQGLIALDKANAGTLHVPALRYRIRGATYYVTEVNPTTGEVTNAAATCGVADWLGEVEGNGRDLARDALAPRIERDNDPRAWLRDYLTAQGQSPRTEVLTAAKEDGFSDSAIKRAARTIVSSIVMSGQRPDGAPYRAAYWALKNATPTGSDQSGHQPDLTHPNDPTDPTGEAYQDPIDPNAAGQSKSGQSGQSSVRGPTGEPVTRLERRVLAGQPHLIDFESGHYYPDPEAS